MASQLQQPVSEAANALLRHKSCLTLLEAGCGSASQIRFPAVAHSVGIDISAEELKKNNDIQDKILGDIQDYPLPKERFDVVVCWMVLEHMPRPKRALANLFLSVKPGGILICGVPNLWSIKGIVTKLTPFWFHAMFYKFMKYKSRHFPTYLRTAMAPERIIRFAQESGFSVAFYSMVEGGVVKKLKSRFRPAAVLFSLMNVAARVVSFGKCQSLLLDECALILTKRAEVLASSQRM